MTTVFDLAENDGLAPKRKTANECACACPFCGGNDRFVIFIETDTYWCRQCGKKGDAIQYFRDFHGMSFPDAAQAVGKELNQDRRTNFKPTTVFNKVIEQPQSKVWQAMAESCISYSAGTLLKNSEALQWLKDKRGITQETAEKFRLGWLEHNSYRKKADWGVESNGKQLFFPSGLTIPWQKSRIRIRRNDPGKYGRYHVVQGSNCSPCLIGTSHEKTAIVVESELDAILLSQEITRDVFIVALGSSAVKASPELIDQLEGCPVVLVALDTDQAGAKASQWWLGNFSNSCRAITPKRYGKDITEAFVNGLDLNAWLSASMELYYEDIATCKAVT